MKFINATTCPWKHAIGEDGPKPDPDPAPHRLLSLEQWHAVRSHWPADVPVAIEFPNDADITQLQPDLGRIALVVLDFPKWTDGRAYSQAHVLRARLRYAGEVRATGDVLVDMLPLLQRTGFTAVQLKDGQSETSARRQLEIVTAHYQGDVVVTRPLFSRVPA